MTSEHGDVGRLLLLGESYGTYGTIASTRVGQRAAAAISVGAEETSPSVQFKADLSTPNEDALCVVEAGDWSAYAVADAHFGPESSHVLLTRLYEIWSKIRPTGLDHLGQMIEFLRNGEPARTDSETTLLVAVHDRLERRGFGISFGDSTFTVAGHGRVPAAINDRNGRFVHTSDRASFRKGAPFWFEVEPGETLLMFTDGVDECCYRQPDLSIRPKHIADLVAASGGDPLTVATELTRLALSGVDGNPGGQDNVVVIAAEA